MTSGEKGECAFGEFFEAPRRFDDGPVTSPGLKIAGDRLILPIQRGCLAFVRWFCVLFVLSFLIGSWVLIEKLGIRVLAFIGGGLVTVGAAFVMYEFARRNEQLGDYLIIDLAAQTISLPRQRMTFSMESLVGFEWLPTSDGEGTEVNLFITENGRLTRYTVGRNIDEYDVNQIARFAQRPLDTKLGYKQQNPSWFKNRKRGEQEKGSLLII